MKKLNLILFIIIISISVHLKAQFKYEIPILINKQTEPKFVLTSSGFSNTQNPNRNFIVFELDSIKLTDLQTSVLSELSAIYKSPSDVINSIGANIISVDGYTSRVFKTKDGYYCDIEFNLIIEFKDGKIRYNAPTIKMIYIDSEFMGLMKIKESSFYSIIFESPGQDIVVASYFNSLIFKLNESVKKNGNDW